MTTAAPASIPHRASGSVARAAAEGLLASPKRLPPWLFYDEEGSRLFEEITRLPEYYLTRTERGLLAAHAGDIAEACGPIGAVVELGAGTAEKTELLLAAILALQTRLIYLPVDVSRTALALAAARLAPRAPALTVRPICARYPEELGWLGDLSGPRLVAFLGSNLGNYEPTEGDALLGAVRARLAPGDALLLGVDLRKSPELLLPAYDDASGVTARFNKNVLRRINRELGATFDVTKFEHVALWNPEQSRIEMHLEARAPFEVTIARLGLRLTFAAGERIHTENSYKFTPAALRTRLRACGFSVVMEARDPEGRFALTLAKAA